MSIAYKKNGVWVTASGTQPIDDALSATSENAVQNKIVKQAVDSKSDTSHNHDDKYYTEAEVNSIVNAINAYIPNIIGPFAYGVDAGQNERDPYFDFAANNMTDGWYIAFMVDKNDRAAFNTMTLCYYSTYTNKVASYLQCFRGSDNTPLWSTDGTKLIGSMISWRAEVAVAKLKQAYIFPYFT